jgi:hypothetical protein
VRFVSVSANRDGKIELWIRGERQNELIECDAADLRWPAEIRIVLHAVADLRQAEKSLARDIALAVSPNRAQKVAVDFEIRWRRARRIEKLGQRYVRGRILPSYYLCDATLDAKFASKTQRERCDRNDVPPLFHVDMLAHARLSASEIPCRSRLAC